MATLENSAALLAKLLEEKAGTVYIRCQPEVPDFTIKEPVKIALHGTTTTIEIELDHKNASVVAGMLTSPVFTVRTLLAWNLKPLLSYFQHVLGRVPNIHPSPLDLCVIEKFLGINESAPENMAMALNRFRRVGEYKSWKKIYQHLHLPLMLRVLPSMETTPLLDEFEKTAKYSYYEIEGQRHARLLSYKKLSYSYLPHTMGDDQKELLIPRGRDNVFVYADINHCEVTVLQWLSQDMQLREIMDSGRDLYERIYEIICNDACNDYKRKLLKLTFLKVIYGMGSQSLSNELHITQEVAAELINRLRKSFPTAFDWIVNQQNLAKENGVAEDYFGRPRTFTEDNYYLARNFVVQSPAATACLEKLVSIHDAMEALGAQLAFSVHDGYGIVCREGGVLKVLAALEKVMSQESKLCPGLMLKFHARYGRKLNALVKP